MIPRYQFDAKVSGWKWILLSFVNCFFHHRALQLERIHQPAASDGCGAGGGEEEKKKTDCTHEVDLD